MDRAGTDKGSGSKPLGLRNNRQDSAKSSRQCGDSGTAEEAARF